MKRGMATGEPKFRVLLADSIAPEGVAILESADGLEVDDRNDLDEEELRSVIGGYQALIVRSRTQVTKEVLDKASELKVIGRAGVGVDNIDLDVATRRGIVVLNAPGGNTVSAAELTFSLALAMIRNIPQADASVRRGEWDRTKFKGVELDGKTLGLVGAGRIGTEVARRARAFGMRVVVYDPYLSKQRAEQHHMELVTLPDLLEESDLVSLHCPLTEETKGLIGSKELALMKKSAYLVNAARGGVVDEDALAEALAEGRLAGAALDVYAREPIDTESPLLELNNVVLSPHLGAATEEAQRSVGIEIAEAVRDALLAGHFLTAVNAPELAIENYSELQPLIDLAHRLGRVVCGLSRGNYRALEVRYAGAHENALRAITAAAVQGLLCEIVEPPLTLVNALHVAEERGVTIKRVGLSGNSSSGELVELRLQTADGAARVAGALLADDRPRIVRIGEYRVDIPPRGTILVLRNQDVPGVIGKVGTILGDAGVNIGEYHQARVKAGGEALAAVALDGAVSRDVMEQLANLAEVKGVWQIQLPSEPGNVEWEVDQSVLEPAR